MFIAFSCSLNLTVGLISEIAYGSFAPLDAYYRFPGILMHPNQQGQACAVLVLTAFMASRALTGWKHVFYRFVTFYGLLFLGLTKSRTSMAALIAGMAVYWFITSSKRRKWRRIYLGFMAALVAILLAGEFLLEELPEAVALGRATEDVMTFTGRIPLWEVCLKYIGDRPLFGYGFEAFWIPKHIDMVSYDVGWGVPSAHSAILELLLTLGIVGLILHALFVALLWRFSTRMFRETGSFEHAIAKSLIALFIVLGSLESTVILAASTTNFYVVTMLLAVAFGAPTGRTVGRKPTVEVPKSHRLLKELQP
jgi:O-antigen ligase